jgi:hypothetical protein
VVLVLVTKAFAFSAASLTSGRVVLLLTIGLALGFGLVLPWYGLNRRRAASRAEAVFPQFQQRLVTFAERQPDGHEPFIELLAADTLELARDVRPHRLVPDRQLLAALATTALCFGLLVWMIVAGPGYLGYGAARLWTGSSHGAAAFFDIRVSPGDAAVRRNASQLITAQLIGLQTQKVSLYARFQSASKWEQVNMEPQPGASGFQFLFAVLPEGVEYYVVAGPLRSPHFNLRVVDLPSIKQIRVTYHFPAWTGLPAAVEEHGGDLRAVGGTEAGLEVFTDRPMHEGILVLDNNRELALADGQAHRYTGAIRIDKDGLYHVAVLDQGQRVRLSDDFFIEAREARPPDVRITRPGGDYRSSPIEEVTVSVKAGDEYGLNGIDFHYSVNGGPPQIVRMLEHKGVKEATGSTTINLEDFKLVPGDLVSFYATAKDARSESRTDMFFIQAEPFEREYSQSQIAGGGDGASGGEQLEISQREKEIIAATWKQQGDKNASRQEVAEAGKYLSGVQTKLRDRALALAGRLRAHGLTVENEDLNGFEENMKAAAEAMGPASEKLRQQKWNDALPREQKALQHLLQAEATFRRMEVAFANQGGGRGAAGSERDLAGLLDLELDTEKNQYETEQTAASAKQRAQEIDEALRKLDELARREQELAERQPDHNGPDVQQRWQQEMLRRDAERLEQQVEQLAQSGLPNASEAARQAFNGRSQVATEQRLQRTLERLRQAREDMRRAASTGQSEAEARRAADRLRDATNLLAGLRQQATSERLDSLAREAGRLAREQREQAARMRQMLGGKAEAGSSDQSRSDAGSEGRRQFADDRQRLADDLSRLETEMRAAERELSSTQRRAALKLSEALDEMKNSELQSRVKRSAESIRQGKNTNSNSEPAIAAGMERLNQQLRQAQQALSGQRQNLEAALDRVERLRGQMEALGRDQDERSNRSGQAGGQAQGSQQSQTEAVGREPGGMPGVQRDSSAASSPSGPTLQQTLHELNGLRQDVRSEPGALADVEELIRELERLGFRGYPGNPALVEQLRAQVLAGVDKIELQLRHELDQAQRGQVRNSDSFRVPPGYQDPVAEYFRRLSKGR